MQGTRFWRAVHDTIHTYHESVMQYHKRERVVLFSFFFWWRTTTWYCDKCSQSSSWCWLCEETRICICSIIFAVHITSWSEWDIGTGNGFTYCWSSYYCDMIGTRLKMKDNSEHEHCGENYPLVLIRISHFCSCLSRANFSFCFLFLPTRLKNATTITTTSDSLQSILYWAETNSITA